MPLENMSLVKQIDKGNSIIIYESLHIDKIKRDEQQLCLNGQTELTFTPIYKFINNNMTPVLDTNANRSILPAYR